MNLIANSIGIPFEVLNCWDLVVLAYELKGIRLKHYTNYLDNISCEWEKTEFLEEDVVLAFDLEGKGNITHVGLYVGDGNFIHSTKYVGVCIEQLGRYMNRLKGIYKYKGGEVDD